MHRRDDAFPESPAARSNPAGDLVVPARVGEVVLLPRLWDFAFQVSPDGSIAIENPRGLSARAERRSDGSVGVTSVTDRGHGTGTIRAAS